MKDDMLAYIWMTLGTLTLVSLLIQAGRTLLHGQVWLSVLQGGIAVFVGVGVYFGGYLVSLAVIAVISYVWKGGL